MNISNETTVVRLMRLPVMYARCAHSAVIVGHWTKLSDGGDGWM